MTPSQERQQRYKTGLRAEQIAAWLLRLKGYLIIGARVRTPVGEIDLIASRGATVVFVEVKARTTPELALSSVSHRQCSRIVAAARVWLAGKPDLANKICRFDIIAVSPYLLPRHLPNAFGEDVSHR